MKRYEKFVIDTQKNINFDVSNEAYSGNYKKPPIPEMYHHVCGEWYNGFVIERFSDKSQFVWIPVGSLPSNGTLYNISFNEKFGRRNYLNNVFSEAEYHEVVVDELSSQLTSVKKYGGFYISRYNISKNSITSKPQSTKGSTPWTNINFNDAKEIARLMECSNTLKSHLTFSSEYDSVLEWFIQSKAKTIEEIIINPRQCGNYQSVKNTDNYCIPLYRTGSHEEWCTNNIYDLAGNVSEWVQEQCGSYNRVIRGGNFLDPYIPISGRTYLCTTFRFINIGFRVALYIK